MTSFGTEHQEFESDSDSYRFEEECWNQTRQTPFTPRHHKAQGSVRTPPMYDVLSFVYVPLLSSILSFAYISFLHGRSPRIYLLSQVLVYSIFIAPIIYSCSHFHGSFYHRSSLYSGVIRRSSVELRFQPAQLKTDSDLGMNSETVLAQLFKNIWERCETLELAIESNFL